MANERPRPTVVVSGDATREERLRLLTLHVLAALSEGICLTCVGDLQPAEGNPRSEPTGRPWTYCQTCHCYWSADHERQTWIREDSTLR